MNPPLERAQPSRRPTPAGGCLAVRNRPRQRPRLIPSLLFFCGLSLTNSLPLDAGVLIATNSVWRYQKGTSEVSSPTNAWRQLDYDDAHWAMGAAPFYYDEGGGPYTGNTLLDDMRYSYTTVYLRQTFVVADRTKLGGLQLRALCDDGFVAWINGVTVTNLNQTSANYAYTNVASSLATEPLQWFTATPQPLPSSIVNGTNLLAVQLFNRPITSSDLLFTLELFTLETDLDPPSIQAVQPPPGTLAALTTITVTFTEPVTGVSASDLLINGIPATAVSVAGAVCTFQLDPPLYGPVAITWDPGALITDFAVPASRFDPTAPSASWQYTLVDTIAPTVAAITPPAGALVTRLDQVSVTFSEPVTGVAASDLRIDGQPASQLSGSLAGPYVFGFPARPDGPVQLSWAANHQIRDLAPQPNAFAGGAWTVTVDANAVLSSIRINEILTAYSGTSGFTDEDDELQDWIELRNTGTNAVNLTGWSLTDDPEDPDQWTFPGVTLGAGQYLVVFASGKDRKPTTPGARLHTSFKLNSAGEFLGLYDANSPRRLVSGFAPAFPEQRSDYSWGYDPGNDQRYFSAPTPGTANGTSSILGVVPPVHFNVERGLIRNPFQLALSDPQPGTVIRFTLDGAEPSSSRGQIYQQPFVLSNTTVVRAAAFLPDHLPSAVQTHSYLFPSQVIQQPADPPGVPPIWIDSQNRTWTADYEMDPEVTTDPQYTNAMFEALTALPVLSVVMKPEDLFDNSTGIYPKSQNRGPSWERPASIEWIYPGGRAPFQIDCGIQCQGNSARDPVKTPKHALRLVFKGDYGARRLDYDVFPDSPLKVFDTLVLRGDFNYSWLHWDSTQRLRAQRTRDAFLKDTIRAMGGLASHNRYVHLYLNGLYWGIYDPTERPDGAFAAAYLGGEKEDYDVINEGSAVDGNMTAYNQMLALTDLADHAQYDRMHQSLEVTRYIDYILAHFYVGHRDWGQNKNWYTFRRRNSTQGFHYVPWDGENILESPSDNRVSSNDTASDLHTRLVANSQYRLDFADRVQRHLFGTGALTPEACRSRWLERATELDLAIIAESARWGDYRRDVHQYSNPPYEFYTRNNQWLTEQNRLLTSYFPVRSANLLSQLKSAGLYPANAVAPTFQPAGGRVTPGTPLSLTTTSGTIYYTTDGTDPRVRYEGTVAPDAQTYQNPLTVQKTVRVLARTLRSGEWSTLSDALFHVEDPRLPVRITEIMYNPIGGEPYEFVEIRNVGTVPIELGGFHWQGIQFVFPPDSWIQPGQFLVLASQLSPASFAARYPGVTVYGYYEDNLGNGGERLALLDAQGRIVVSVDYDDTDGWPATADGQGPSLEILDPLGAPDEPANWQASSTADGSPGRANSTTPVPNVRLNEVMADNRSTLSQGGGFPDWIELHNTGSLSANLEGWSLTDDGNPRKFVVPAGTSIAAGAYLVVYCDANVTAPGLHTGFALDRQGETLSFYDPQTNRVDALTFGTQLPDLTIGRLDPAGGWALCQPTPATTNVAQPTATSRQLILNEWLANARPGQPDWIELQNRDTNLPVALRGHFIATSNALARVDSLSFVAPGGFALFLADEQPGPDHLDLRLPAEGGWIALYDPVGIEIDRVTYGAQTEAVSQGRLPDGSTTTHTFPESASPGASNYLLAYSGPTLEELLAWNAGAVTNATGRIADFVELYHPGVASFDLSGMILSDTDDPADGWAFPTNTTIAAGSRLVVWFDPDEPASTNDVAPFNSGRGLSRQGGELSLWNRDGQKVDSIRYGNQVRNLSIGRSAAGWTLLSAPTPGAVNALPATIGSPASLRINEWMAQPLGGNDWLELYNDGPSPVPLEGCGLSDDPSLTATYKQAFGPLGFVDAHDFLWLESGPKGTPGSLEFDLDAAGEMIQLADPDGQLIDAVYFGAQPAGVSSGRLPDGAGRFVGFTSTASPEASNFLRLPNAWINEVLTHTDPPLEDALELYNPSDTPADLGGWFLSDDPRQLKQFRIPDGTTLPAQGFVVFYETNLNGGTGSLFPFTFDSAHGDAVYLSQADSQGNLTGYRDQVTFGAAPNGCSFGRITTSIGDQWTLLSRPTYGIEEPQSLDEFRTGLGASNAPPRISPIVVSEIMYHPPAVDGVFEDERLSEYLELHNHHTETVSLFDPAFPTNTWRITGGVELEFPAGLSLTPGGCLLVVGFDPVADAASLAAFRQKYEVPAEVTFVGPFQGRLANQGEDLLLLEPDTPQSASAPDAGYVPYFVAEWIRYQPAAPWPAVADGNGASLQRKPEWDYPNEPAAWIGAAPTPGVASSTPATTNQPPVFDPVPTPSVTEGENLQLTLVAADPDLPAQRLTFSLLEAPLGMQLEAMTGLLSWTPLEFQGPATHRVRVRAADNGVPILSATNLFDIIVVESNLPPTLDTVPDQILEIGSTLALELAASDPDLPTNRLTFELVSGPAGAYVDPATGWLSWTPAVADSGGSHPFVVRVTDDGVPARSGETQFAVLVPAPEAFSISDFSFTQGVVAIVWATTPGTAYAIQYAEDVAAGAWRDLVRGIVATGTSLRHVDAPPPGSPARFYRIVILL